MLRSLPRLLTRPPSLSFSLSHSLYNSQHAFPFPIGEAFMLNEQHVLIGYSYGNAWIIIQLVGFHKNP